MNEMAGVLAKGWEIGKRVARETAIEAAEVLAQELPGAVVEATESGVKVAGKALAKRLIDGAAVRGLGILMRALKR